MVDQPSANVEIKNALSARRIVFISLFSSCSVLVVSLVLQWLIYDDWLHETGPLRIVGTVVAALLTFGFVYHWFLNLRRHEEEMKRRFKTIAEMNDRIRNALQMIECTTYASAPQATEHVKNAVAIIDEALRGVVAEARPGATIAAPPAQTPDARRTASSS